jgi:ribosome-associated protein
VKTSAAGKSGKAPAAKKRAVTAKSSLKPAAAPRPRKRTVPAVVVSAPPEDSRMLGIVLAKLDDMKAENPVVIDMRGKSLFSDHMVVASGRSNRHVAACAESVAKGLKDAGAKKVHMEGLSNADWVLIDTGEVIVHIFRPEVREFYNLERLWSQNPDALARPA